MKIRMKRLIDSIKFTRAYYAQIPQTKLYEDKYGENMVDAAFLRNEAQKWRNLALSLLSEKYGDRR